MTEKSIIIIGAGLAGLSAGCYSQMNGYQTRIFEHHTTPGGVATCWERKGYMIDGGIHFLMCHKPGQSKYELYRELGTAQSNRFLDMTSYCRFTIHRRPYRRRPWNAGNRYGGYGHEQPLLGFMDKVRQMWKMRRIFKYFTGIYARSAADYGKAIHEPWLRYIFENLFLPEVPVWFILMLLGLLADGQLGLLEAGSLNFVLPIEKRYRNWKLTRPLVMISFVVAREFKGEPCLNIIKMERPFTTGSKGINSITVRIFNYTDRLAPPGKTVVQVIFETEFDWWNELQKDRKSYEAEKERVAKQVLERLEARYPGISSQVEMIDVATPYTWWRYTHNYKGAYMGWLTSSEMINAQIKKTLPGLGNFYMAGHWATPGGGVVASLYSGRHVVQILCYGDGKQFSIVLA